MSAYLWIMIVISLVIFLLYGLYCSKAAGKRQLLHRPWQTAGLAFLFSLVFGTVMARISYALLMLELDFEYDGIAAFEQLLWFDIDHVSFFGGAVGVVGGVAMANYLTRREAMSAGMDAFAPFGALLVALFRLGEGFFGSYGTGSILPPNSPFAFFPFALEIAVDGGYSYWGYAIFSLSAVLAILWAAIAFFCLRDRGRPGLSFTLTLFFLALPQIFCESLRKRGLFWLFVHTEQLLCVILLAVLLLFWILKSPQTSSLARRWAPFGVLLLCSGLLIAVEFAIDGKLFDLPHWICYTFMLLVLVTVGTAGYTAAKHWNDQKKTSYHI